MSSKPSISNRNRGAGGGAGGGANQPQSSQRTEFRNPQDTRPYSHQRQVQQQTHQVAHMSHMNAQIPFQRFAPNAAQGGQQGMPANVVQAQPPMAVPQHVAPGGGVPTAPILQITNPNPNARAGGGGFAPAGMQQQHRALRQPNAYQPHRPPNASQQMPGMNQILYSQYPYPPFTHVLQPSMPFDNMNPSIANAPHFTFLQPQPYMNSFPHQHQPQHQRFANPPMPMPNNVMPSNAEQQQQQQQAPPQPQQMMQAPLAQQPLAYSQPTERPLRREKKIMAFTEEDGTPVDLPGPDSKRTENSTATTKVPVTNQKTIPVVENSHDKAAVASVNGDDKEIVLISQNVDKSAATVATKKSDIKSVGGDEVPSQLSQPVTTVAAATTAAATTTITTPTTLSNSVTKSDVCDNASNAVIDTPSSHPTSKPIEPAVDVAGVANAQQQRPAKVETENNGSNSPAASAEARWMPASLMPKPASNNHSQAKSSVSNGAANAAATNVVIPDVQIDASHTDDGHGHDATHSKEMTTTTSSTKPPDSLVLDSKHSDDTEPMIVVTNESSNDNSTNDLSIDSEKLSSIESPTSEISKSDDQSEEVGEDGGEDKDAKKVYDRKTLLDLKSFASETAFEKAHKNNIQDIIRRNKSQSSSMDFLPTFASGRGSDTFRNKSQGQPVRRPSQPSKNYQDMKTRKIASTSLNYDHHNYHHSPGMQQHSHALQLASDPNAWKPGKATSTDPHEIETEELLKKVRAILNKLTPENYENLLKQFKALKIDTEGRLAKVIDVIFEKAVKEPSFVVQYAGFCSELVHIKVEKTDDNDKKAEVKFKNLLIKKCEETFYKQIYSDIPDYDAKLTEIDECTDPIKKRELEMLLDHEKTLSRKRSVGNIKLIAQLFKINMLNVKIMFSCFQCLIGNGHEDYIECLCALITNIGAAMSERVSNVPHYAETFDNTFKKLKDIHDGKTNIVVSSRVRFMILDLIDLRANNWVPRMKTIGPKLISEVHQDLENQQRQKTMELNELKIRRRNNQMDEWQQVGSNKGGKRNQTYHVSHPSQNKLFDISSLKETMAAANIQSGASGQAANKISPFGMFAQGSHGGNSNSQSRSNSSTYDNKFNALSSEKQSGTSRLFGRDVRKVSDVTNHYAADRDNSLPNSRNNSAVYREQACESAIAAAPLSEAELDAELKKHINAKMDLNRADETIQSITSFCHNSNFGFLVYWTLRNALENFREPERIMVATFLGKLFMATSYETFQILEGYKRLFSESVDLICDVPKLFEFVGVMTAYILIEIDSSELARKKDCYKNISNALKEVTDQRYEKMIQATSDTIVQQKGKEVAQKIMSLIQTDTKKDSEFGNLDSINFVEHEASRLITLIKEKFANELSIPTFKSALYRHFAADIHGNKDNKDVVTNLMQALKEFVTSEEDELLVLQATLSLNKSLSYPPNYYEHRVISVDVFWRLKKAPTDAIGLASLERFYKSFPSSNSA